MRWQVVAVATACLAMLAFEGAALWGGRIDRKPAVAAPGPKPVKLVAVAPSKNQEAAERPAAPLLPTSAPTIPTPEVGPPASTLTPLLRSQVEADNERWARGSGHDHGGSHDDVCARHHMHRVDYMKRGHWSSWRCER